MNKKKTCQKRVFSGERNDMGGHMCGHAAINGTEFCHLHGGKPAAPDPTAPAKADPQSSGDTSIFHKVKLVWAAGDGPVVKLPYSTRYGFITSLVGTAETGVGLRVVCRGVLRKNSGDPGVQSWDADSYSSQHLVPQVWLDRLQDMVDELEAEL